MGECDANAGYMQVSCRKSCGVCPTKRSSGGAGAGAGARSRQSGSGGSGDSSGAGQKQEEKSAGPVTSDELLGDGAYELHLGRFGGSKKSLHTGRFDLRGARAWCDARPNCAGFTAQVAEPNAVTQAAGAPQPCRSASSSVTTATISGTATCTSTCTSATSSTAAAQDVVRVSFVSAAESVVADIDLTSHRRQCRKEALHPLMRCRPVSLAGGFEGSRRADRRRSAA